MWFLESISYTPRRNIEFKKFIFDVRILSLLDAFPQFQFKRESLTYLQQENLARNKTNAQMNSF